MSMRAGTAALEREEYFLREDISVPEANAIEFQAYGSLGSVGDLQREGEGVVPLAQGAGEFGRQGEAEALAGESALPVGE